MSPHRSSGSPPGRCPGDRRAVLSGSSPMSPLPSTVRGMTGPRTSVGLPRPSRESSRSASRASTWGSPRRHPLAAPGTDRVSLRGDAWASARSARRSASASPPRRPSRSRSTARAESIHRTRSHAHATTTGTIASRATVQDEAGGQRLDRGDLLVPGRHEALARLGAVREGAGEVVADERDPGGGVGGAAEGVAHLHPRRAELAARSLEGQHRVVEQDRDRDDDGDPGEDGDVGEELARPPPRPFGVDRPAGPRGVQDGHRVAGLGTHGGCVPPGRPRAHPARADSAAPPRRIAVLDDYQQVASTYADWDALGADEVTFFAEHLGDAGRRRRRARALRRGGRHARAHRLPGRRPRPPAGTSGCW